MILLENILDRPLIIPSLFDFLIVLVLIFGLFRGYTQGFIVQALSLFALLVGIYISALASMGFYNSIVDKSNVPLQSLPLITFALLFGLTFFASNWVGMYVKRTVATLKLNIYSRVWGAFFGMIKYLFITSIILMFFHNIAYNFDWVDKRHQIEAEDSYSSSKDSTNAPSVSMFYDPVRKFAPVIIPRLKFEIVQPSPMELNDITNEPDDIPELSDDYLE